MTRLRQQTDLLKAELDSIIEDLEKEGKVLIKGDKRRIILSEL
jgi:hypothetical protein